MKKLREAGLFGGALVTLSGSLAKRYNACLAMLGVTPTKLKTFSIDGMGWSPEVAVEKKENYYLNTGEANVNAIIISVALSSLLPKLDNPSNSYLVFPTLIFLFFTMISMVLSVLATRPNVTRGKFTKDDVKEKKVNLLFFGNFHKNSLPEFEWAMGEMMKDKD